MNLSIMKEQFPNSYSEIEEWYSTSSNKKMELVLTTFLKQNECYSGTDVLEDLRRYECIKAEVNSRKDILAKGKGRDDWNDYLLYADPSEKHHKALDEFWNGYFKDEVLTKL